jgi:carbonic anhydrase
MAMSAAACAGSSGTAPAADPQPAVEGEAAGAERAEDHDAHGRTKRYLTPEESPGIIQSPVNILTSEAQEGESLVRLHYGEAKEHTKNLGHTVQVSFDEQTNWVEVDGDKFELLQFHFHTPSEHLVDGVTYPMEMHLVHKKVDSENQYLVIGVLFKEGAPSPLLESFLADVPEAEGQTGPTGLLNLAGFTDPNAGFWSYRGSLTTPPYTETVRWYVSKEVHVASPEQVEHIYRLEGDNARRIQVFRGRRLLTN